MSRQIAQVELIDELSKIEQDALYIASTWKRVTAAAGAGDVSKVSDVLVLADITHEMIQTVKKLVVKMARAGFGAGDIQFNRCLALLCSVVNLSEHHVETVHAARRVVELQTEVQAARGFH